MDMFLGFFGLGIAFLIFGIYYEKNKEKQSLNDSLEKEGKKSTDTGIKKEGMLLSEISKQELENFEKFRKI